VTTATALRVALVLGVVPLGAPLGAQASRTPTIPTTAAGRVLRTWLEANNSGDGARLAAYYRRYQPSLPAGFEPTPRKSACRYDLPDDYGKVVRAGIASAIRAHLASST
jgi:hypothetical protein